MKNVKEKISLAFELFDQGDLLQAEKIYTDCLNEISDKKSSEYKEAFFGMGYVKSHLNKFEEASYIFKEMIKWAIESGDISEEAMYIHQLGMVERMAQNYEDALKLFNEEFGLLESHNLNTDVTISANHYEKGYIHFLQNEIEAAIELMQKSLEHAKLSEDKICIGCAYRGLGEIQKAEGNNTKANEFFHNAIMAFREANDEVGVKEIKDLMN